MPVEAPLINTVLPANEDMRVHPPACHTSRHTDGIIKPERVAHGAVATARVRARDTLPRRVAE